ncbi:uncharacterized protein N7458_012663 [Penicillium daleae]|uniref:C2H2-type domain-containing protein n=1 Tax=Penicillium daleae TaxID=63821 RepID=A0AAD6BV86_9EURO|nr:uncharacterized protein N7458_012663 [Penicillium daleae]KAJ5433507.1 hypothetical protein N7458_012663 [Penicillium daleae]
MSGAEVIAVVACVAAVVSAYHDGHQLLNAIKKKWKEHRQSKALANAATTNDLEWSLRRGREDIVTQWNSHAGQLGRRFEDGDPLAREQMKDIVIELQRALLTNLRENNAHLDLLALLQASDRGRKDTILVFHNLYQRLAQAASIPAAIDFGPIPFDPTSRLWYWMNLIENQYLAQVPSSRYIQSLPSSPGGRVLPAASSGSPADMISFLRQMEEQASPSQSRRSSKTSLGSLFSSRRRSSVEAYSQRVDSGSRLGSFGSGSGLSPMPEMPDHYTIVDRPREGSPGSLGAYAADMQEYLEQDRTTAARLQQTLQQEQGRNETQAYTPEDRSPPTHQHESAPSNSIQHKMDYDDLTREMTANPWSVDAGPEPVDTHWNRTSSPESITEPAVLEPAHRTNIIDTRHLLGMDAPWADQSSPLPIPERRRPAMTDTGLASSGFTPQLQTEETIRQDHYTNLRYHHPTPPQPRPTPQPNLPRRTNSRDAPIPTHHPPIRTPISHTRHTPSIASTNSTTSSTSSNPSTSTRPFWPPSNANDYAGFCKGAWKLHSGLGGFKVHSEPKGYYTMESKWRCATCFFEMPLAPDSDRHDPKHNTKLFVHAPTGIQFRWAFLAKSHVRCKRRPGGAPKLASGPFGCIFCCRERRVSAPVFQGLDEFMGHIGGMHRDCVEGMLLERACCVVGRVAGAEEVFDVNIPPESSQLAGDEVGVGVGVGG